MREWFLKTGCAALIGIAMSSGAAAQTLDRTPSVIVCLKLSPQLALDSLVAKGLLAEVQTIWKALGAEIRSVEDSDDGCARIVAVKADREALPEEAAREDAIGWVPFAAGQARQLVFLRVSRARLMVARGVTALSPDAFAQLILARLLGRAVAHELGHVLLNSSSHGAAGLMRANYGVNDAWRLNAAAYTLSADERALLFTRMATGSRLAVR